MFSPTLLTRLLERVVAFDLGKECWKRADVVKEFGAAPAVCTLSSRK